jgi:hypothetical protein
MNETIERQTASKVGCRLLPIIVLMYFLSCLDRVNVGFGALTANKDLAFAIIGAVGNLGGVGLLGRVIMSAGLDARAQASATHRPSTTRPRLTVMPV